MLGRVKGEARICRSFCWARAGEGGKHVVEYQKIRANHKNRLVELMILEYCLVSELCPTLGDPMDCRMPDFPVLYYRLQIAQVHVHWFSDAIQPSDPLLSSCP